MTTGVLVVDPPDSPELGVTLGRIEKLSVNASTQDAEVSESVRGEFRFELFRWKRTFV